MSSKKKPTSEEKVAIIIGALEDKKAVEPIVIPVRERTLMTDSIVIATGTSRIHIRALMEAVVDTLADNGVKGKRVEGSTDCGWLLLDYGEVVVHIMSEEQREFYRLEAYWSGEEKGSPPPLPC